MAAQGAITTTTYYLFPHYKLEVTGTTGTIRRSYFFAGRRIAQTVNGGTVTYLHADQLGSTVLTTGVGGSQKYHAYGATRSSGTVQTKYQFTGQEADGGTGLIYMQARYYDPVIGQFISPDTIVPDPTNVYAYNRYMYAYGNPLKYNDPTGHQAACVLPTSTDPEGLAQTAVSCLSAAQQIVQQSGPYAVPIAGVATVTGAGMVATYGGMYAVQWAAADPLPNHASPHSPIDTTIPVPGFPLGSTVSSGVSSRQELI